MLTIMEILKPNTPNSTDVTPTNAVSTSEPHWDPVPLENMHPEAWKNAVDSGRYDAGALEKAQEKTATPALIVRGTIPLLAKREDDGSVSLPIKRAGSLFSVAAKRELKERGLRRLRVSPDGNVSLIGDDNDTTVTNPRLEKRELIPNNLAGAELSYTIPTPKVKSWGGKLHFVIFH